MTVAPPRALERRPVIVAIGNPNVGKSTLYNRLTGLRQKVANYPGVTVEHHEGYMVLCGREARLVDLPGMYSLAAHSPDEVVATDVLLGRVQALGPPDAVLMVVDACNLRRNLFLLSQILELGVPLVVALTMTDLAPAKGIRIDAGALERRLGVPVVPVMAARGEGIDALRAALATALEGCRPVPSVVPEIKAAARRLAAGWADAGVAEYDVERALIDEGGYAEERLGLRAGPGWRELLKEARRALAEGQSLAALEARRRYAWIHTIIAEVEVRGASERRWSDRIDTVLSHPLIGSLIFITLMATVFQSVFTWATPLMDTLDELTRAVSAGLEARLPEGALASLLVDGAVAGVGSVVVFLPQILILFAFIILLEDTGYMARAAFLMDRIMRLCGLSGQSFIPMLSSFACAVPGILATRVIPNPRDRIATILAAPFMTCSARLPVYALLIAAFIPERSYLYGLLNLQGLVLLGLYLLGICGGIATAWWVKRGILRGPTPAFVMELPPFRWPRLRSVAFQLYERARVFLVRAGTIIFTVSVMVWALAYFPHPRELHQEYEGLRAAAAASLEGERLAARSAQIDHLEAAAFLEQSTLGRIGKAVEPAFQPLGWDWKVAAAVIASFPAREVVIAVLGTIYAVGAEVEASDAGLIKRLQASTWPDGRKVFSASMAIGLMLFYAFCLQCTATVAVIRRETGSWGWAGFAWLYMTTLGYSSALLCFQAAHLL